MIWLKEEMLTNFTCAYCGTVNTKSAMVVSKFTGRAWCIDQDACRRRVDLTIKRNRRLNHERSGL